MRGPSFDLAVSLKRVTQIYDVVYIALFEKILEQMSGVIMVPNQDEVGAVIGEDLPEGPIFFKTLVQHSDRVISFR